MSLARQVSTEVTTAVRLAPARPAVTAGLRAAIVTVLPLLLGQWLHEPRLSWVSFAGFLTTIVDKGGAYQTRALTTSVFAVGGALSSFVAALAGNHAWTAIPLMFLWGVGCGFIRVYGNELASAGSSAAVAFAVSMASPVPTWAEAASRALFALAGSAWAMSLILLFWPVRFYRPARRAVSGVYRELAQYLGELGQVCANPTPAAEWPALAHQRHLRIREALEAARVTLASIRRGKQSETYRGGVLVLLLERADQIFALSATLSDVLDAVGHHPRDAAFREESGRLLFSAAATLETLAVAIDAEVGAPRGSLDWHVETLRELFAEWGHPDDAPAPEPARRATYAHIVDVLSRMRKTLERAVREAQGLEHDRPVSATGLDAGVSQRSLASRLLGPVQANFSLDSLVLRHALRVGTMAAFGVVVVKALGLHYGHWVTLAVIVVLQPYTGATRLKSLQRVIGTVLGGVLATLLAAAVHGTAAMFAVIFLLAGVSVTLLPFNYAVYSLFLTPTFVLLTELRVGDWSLAGTRIMNNIIGSGLALLGALLLWPAPERTRFPAELGAALQALQDYLQLAVDVVLQDASATRDRLSEVRRRVGLAFVNVDASLQRLVAESPGHEAELEVCLALLVHARRLSSSITTLITLPSQPLAPADAASIRRSTERLLQRLGDAAAVVQAQPARVPEPSNGVEWPTSYPLLQAQLERVERRLLDLQLAARRVPREWVART